MILAQQWRDFICDPARPGRYLSSIGRGVVGDEALEIELNVLHEFLARLSGARADVELLANAVDLAHVDYSNFFRKTLPGLLDVLSSEQVGQNAIVGPGLRGNPDWSKTAVGRASRKVPITHYATRLPARSFHLPENMLLGWLVRSVAQSIQAMEMRIGSAALPDRLIEMRTACTDALAHDWFRDVVAPQSLAPEMFASARRHRNPAYREAGELASRRWSRTSGTAAARWTRTLDLLRANWLAPENTDDLFELYALTLVLDVIEQELGFGSPAEFGLAVPGRSHVALFNGTAAGRLRVFFDQSPSVVLGEPSRYREIIAAHRGALGTARRPDVTIARYVQGEDRPIVLFVEVKETRDSVYTSDSIYKAMGYAFDYSSLWNVGPPCPKVILLFPEAIAREANSDITKLDVTLVSSLDREALVTALRARLDISSTTTFTSA